MVDFALQRKNMVESQVRPSDVTDRRIMTAMQEIPREAFCPPSQAATAYRDEALLLGETGNAAARYALAPRTLARLIQALDLGDHDNVLEIGAGAGYATCILSRMAQKVTAIEADATLVAAVRKGLEAQKVANVTVVEGSFTAGHAPGAPYDAILIGGGVEQVPRALLDQLKDGGRLAAIVIGGGAGKLTQWRRLGGTFDSRIIGDAAAPRLAAFDKPKEFVF